MTRKPLLAALFFFAITLRVSAQLPEKAEDISPLLIGESFPDENLVNLKGDGVSILDLVKEKPTVVIFYRGGWCPYCNRHLAEIGQREEEILSLGYQVLAVSPDKAEKLRETADKNELKYRLFSDEGGVLAKAVGIAFDAPGIVKSRLKNFSDGKNEGYLPVPSVFVLNTGGEILFEYINPDYKQRIGGDLLLAVLTALKGEG
ncbi:MAG TPA: peroxiredoxin-like family protein [Flavilitoribacter sp.]|nr:peroxiredoxin-like family protein [Flavilitoribacter sp.]